MLKRAFNRARVAVLGAILFARSLFAAGVIASEATVTGLRQPLGYTQILNATLAASTGIVMTSANAAAALKSVQPGYVIVQCQGGTVRWRDDGVAPTAAIGMVIPQGGELDYAGDPSALRFISSSGTPILDVSVYA